MWFINSYTIAYLQRPWSKLVEKNPTIQTQYDEIIQRLTDHYKKHFGIEEVPAKHLLEDRGTFTDLSNKSYTGYLITDSFGGGDTVSLDKSKYIHKLVLTMDGEMPIEMVEISCDHIQHTAKIIQFPRAKRQPREFFLKE